MCARKKFRTHMMPKNKKSTSFVDAMASVAVLGRRQPRKRTGRTVRSESRELVPTRIS